MYEYITEGMESTITASTMDIMSHVIVGIYEESRRQSEQDLSDLRSLKNNLMSVKSLNVKEHFPRICCVYLVLSNYFLTEDLCKKRKKSSNDPNIPLLTIDLMSDYFTMLEETLLFFYC